MKLKPAFLLATALTVGSVSQAQAFGISYLRDFFRYVTTLNETLKLREVSARLAEHTTKDHGLNNFSGWHFQYYGFWH